MNCRQKAIQRNRLDEQFKEWLLSQYGKRSGSMERQDLETPNTDQHSSWDQLLNRPDLSTSVECKICVRQFSDEVSELTPRILTSCGHTVCEDCATKLLHEFNITCPFDRKTTTVNSAGISNLQKNFTLLEVLQEQKAQQLSEERIEEEEKARRRGDKIEVRCFENPNHEAIYYCEQCDAGFCKKCFKQVHYPKIFSSHRKIFVSEKLVKLPKCTKHPFYDAEFICTENYCEDPSDRMCHICILSEFHEGHHYEPLKEQLVDLKTLLEKLRQSTRNLETQVAKSHECIESFETDGQVFNEIIQKIHRKFEEKKAKAVKDFTDFSILQKKLTKKNQEKLEEHLELARVLETKIQTKLIKKTDFGNVGHILVQGTEICDSVEGREELKMLNEHTLGQIIGLDDIDDWLGPMRTFS